MPENFEYCSKLTQLVSAGELEILYLVSPPRTISTILEIALAEYGHGQIHEPFHKRRRLNFDDGCRIVYERYLELSKTTANKPVKIVIKDLSKFLKADEWKKLVVLSKNVIFTIREPSRQIFSMASRYANDLEDYDTDKLSYEQILKNLPRIPFEDLALGYWENLLTLYQIAEDNLSSTKEKDRHLAVISGMSFRVDPLDSLRKLVNYLELEVDPQKLLKNWTVGTGNNFYRPEYIINRQPNDKHFSKGAWLGPALNSKEFWVLDPQGDTPKDIDIYDAPLQEYFLNNILPVYVKLYLNKNNVCKPDIEIVSTQDFLQSSLMKSNPIEAFLLCNSFQTNNSKQQTILKENADYAKSDILKKYPIISKKLIALVEKEIK